MVLSLIVNGKIEQSVFRSVSTNELWVAKFAEISTLGGLASAVDAPGNDVFIDRDIAGGRARMRQANDSFMVRIDGLRDLLPPGLAPHDTLILAYDLDRLAMAMPEVRQQAESVFKALARHDAIDATHHMARMDKGYGATLFALRTLRSDLSNAQNGLIQAERDNAVAASRLLRLAGLAMFLLAVGGGISGQRLAREVERQTAERDSTMKLVAKAQAELEEAHARLTDAHQELETFSYSVAHDLRAPLRGIHGFSEALAQDSGALLNDEGRAHLERIQGASLRMGALIDDLLRLSRVSRQALVTTPLNLGAVAAEVVAELRAGDPGREVEVVIEPGMEVTADPTLMRVLLENLLGNAWKFTRNASRPRITIGRDHADQFLTGVFRIQDNGAGFDMRYAKKLFGAFQRLHTTTEFEGTGVGLATVYRIVTRHGGRVWAEAAVGQGATFRFTLRRQETR